MRAAPVAAALALAGCPSGPGARTPVAARTDGLVVTYYRERGADGDVTTLAVVEQRRWIEVGADRTLEIDRIDDAADLASLVIEPLGGTLELGRCARDSVVQTMRNDSAWVGRSVAITVADGRTVAGTVAAIQDGKAVIASADGTTTMVGVDAWTALHVDGGDSVVRCAVAAGSGRQLVRVVYSTGALGYTAEHTIRAALDDADRGTAQVFPRFTVDTPPWQVTADVALHDGMPGGARPPREVFRGPITLGGEPVVVAGPTITAPVRVEAVFRADFYAGDDTGDPSWRAGATFGDVYDWLELDLGDAPLAPGVMMLEVSRPGVPGRLVTVESDALDRPDPDADGAARTRIKLWPSPDLKGGRSKVHVSSTGTTLVESVVLSISNGGETPRQVVVEEELRPHRRRLTVVRPFPKKPALRDNVLRLRLAVPPGATRAGYILDYEL